MRGRLGKSRWKIADVCRACLPCNLVSPKCPGELVEIPSPRWSRLMTSEAKRHMSKILARYVGAKAMYIRETDTRVLVGHALL